MNGVVKTLSDVLKQWGQPGYKVNPLPEALMSDAYLKG